MPAPKPDQTLKILASRFKEVADLVAENDKLKDALAAYQTKAAPSLAVEPEGTPLPTEPEPVDESAAGGWDETAEPEVAAEPEAAAAKKTAKKTAKK